MSADGVALWIGEHGPTIARANAMAFSANVVERRRQGAEYVFDLEVEAIEIGRVLDA